MALFCFSILFYGFSNIFSLIPSGNRFMVLSNTFIFAFLILFINSYPKIKGMTFIQLISVPLLLFFCIVSIRTGMDFFGVITVLGNPIAATLDIESIPLITGIKRFLF
jgi:hypothetical protein